ncbi:MAG: hypothetical protein FWC50_03550 [Planctomycetaceae bacterium]|nr:hypothetical protein [Planctomycetaceae bacterium]
MASKIDPKMISTDCGTQSRIEMNETVIADYAEAMERGDEFPAILVFYDEAKHRYILVDGFHRYFAHMRAKPNDPILAEPRIGTVEDAIWESLAANKSHGLRRSNADKRNAIKQALLHPKGVDLSNSQIAKHVGVHHDTVGVIRCELELTCGIRKSDLRIGQDGRVINTKNIGSKPSSPESCSNCLNFMDSRGECMLDSSKRTPWTEACEEFEAIPPEPGRRELENIPDEPDEYEEIDLKKRSTKRNPGRYESRNTVYVNIPLGNPQMAAAELRFRLGNEYFEQCTIASNVLIRASHDDDPFPNL